MKYAVVITERVQVDRSADSPMHWLKRGTLVRVLNDKPDDLGLYVIETLYPVFTAIPELTTAEPRYQVVMQHTRRKDFYVFPDAAGPFIEATAQYFRQAREFFGV